MYSMEVDKQHEQIDALFLLELNSSSHNTYSLAIGREILDKTSHVFGSGELDSLLSKSTIPQANY